jgi:hypothetical protein
MYGVVTRTVNSGIDGYQLVKKYEDPAAQLRTKDKTKKKVRALKRGSYLDDELLAKRDIPGVSKYNLAPKEQPKKPGLKSKSPRKTYLDEAMRKSTK